jgi:transposase-like protein
MKAFAELVDEVRLRILTQLYVSNRRDLVLAWQLAEELEAAHQRLARLDEDRSSIRVTFVHEIPVDLPQSPEEAPEPVEVQLVPVEQESLQETQQVPVSEVDVEDLEPIEPPPSPRRASLITPELLELVKRRSEEGGTLEEIAGEAGVSVKTIGKARRELGLVLPGGPRRKRDPEPLIPEEDLATDVVSRTRRNRTAAELEPSDVVAALRLICAERHEDCQDHHGLSIEEQRRLMEAHREWCESYRAARPYAQRDLAASLLQELLKARRAVSA